MKYTWMKRADIEVIGETIKNFFESRNFEVKEFRDKSSKRIYIVKSKSKVKRKLHMKIEVYNTDKGIILETGNAKNTRLALISSYLMQFMGAGIILKKLTETNEFYQKVEQKLVKEIEKAIARTNS